MTMQQLSSVSLNSNQFQIMTQLGLRISAAVLAIASIILMAIYDDKHSVTSYKLASGFKYFYGVNITVSAVSLLSAIVVFVLNRQLKFEQSIPYCSLWLVDLITVTLMTSGCAVASAIEYLAFHGQSKSLWIPVCDIKIVKVCEPMLISIILSSIAMLSLFVLTIISSYHIMNINAKSDN